METRIGPRYLYSPYKMPEELRTRFFKEFPGHDVDAVIYWVVGNPGGPFSESLESYTVENFGDTIQFNLDVDAWLKSVGAVTGEEAIIAFR